MKKVNKDIYHEARYGRRALIIFASVILAILVAVLGFGIALVVLGCKSEEAGQIAWKIAVGIVLIILALASGTISFVMLITGCSMIKTNEGSVKDGNRAIGTVNVLKCDKCGSVVPDEAAFCPKCGTAVEGVVKCEECGTVNNLDAQYCSGCGKELKK